MHLKHYKYIKNSTNAVHNALESRRTPKSQIKFQILNSISSVKYFKLNILLLKYDVRTERVKYLKTIYAICIKSFNRLKI